MSEVENTLYCENCGSTARLIFDPEEVSYAPEHCPFCGEVIGSITDEYDDEDELNLDDDGLGDDENDISWN